MINAAEYQVVARAGQDYGPAGQLYPEPAADQDDHGGALLTGDPLRTLVPAGMHSPLDFDIRAMPDVSDRHEVPEQPAATGGGIRGCVTHVDVLGHEAGR